MSLAPSQKDGPDPGRRTDRLTPEAFAELFSAHSRTLWCIAAGVLVNADQAEDVLQDGAMIALQKLDQFEPETRFVAWMARIIRYVALNHGRRRRRMIVADPESFAAMVAPERDRPRTAGAHGDLDPDQSAFDDDVVHALASLEETARACMLLRTVLDMPYREISLALDIPEGTAMSHVHRSRRTLRRRLSAGDAAPSAAAAEGREHG